MEKDKIHSAIQSVAKKGANEVTVTLRMCEDMHADFKKYAFDTNISMNSAIKVAACIGMKLLRGQFQKVALIESPLVACNTSQT